MMLLRRLDRAHRGSSGAGNFEKTAIENLMVFIYQSAVRRALVRPDIAQYNVIPYGVPSKGGGGGIFFFSSLVTFFTTFFRSSRVVVSCPTVFLFCDRTYTIPRRAFRVKSEGNPTNSILSRQSSVSGTEFTRTYASYLRIATRMERFLKITVGLWKTVVAENSRGTII